MPNQTATDERALRLLEQLAGVGTPAYVADEARLASNLAVLADLKSQSGAQIVYAMKACPLHPIFPMISEVLDGSTASGLNEARLGLEAFGKQVHVYCPAYTVAEITALLALGYPLHVYFNTLNQLHRYAPMVRAASPGHHIGLRVNPALSLTSLDKYNPCRRGSHLGVPLEQLATADLSLVDTLHVHALCENIAEDSAELIDHVSEVLAPWLPKIQSMNFGGGHYITHPDYHRNVLVAALGRFRARYPQIACVLEPGAAVVYDAGYLVGRVLEVMENDGVWSAILDISANCHVPDVIKTGLNLPVLNARDAGVLEHTYTLVGRTCMARDVWGDYSFAAPLQAGQPIIIQDALQYSLAEANWFNGHPRPSLGWLRKNGDYEQFRTFDYTDFKYNCG